MPPIKKDKSLYSFNSQRAEKSLSLLWKCAPFLRRVQIGVGGFSWIWLRNPPFEAFSFVWRNEVARLKRRGTRMKRNFYFYRLKISFLSAFLRVGARIQKPLPLPFSYPRMAHSSFRWLQKYSVYSGRDEREDGTKDQTGAAQPFWSVKGALNQHGRRHLMNLA